MLPSQTLKKPIIAIIGSLMILVTIYFAIASGYVGNLFLNHSFEEGSGLILTDYSSGKNMSLPYAEWTTDSKIGSYALEFWNISNLKNNIDNFGDASINSLIWQELNDNGVPGEHDGFAHVTIGNANCGWGIVAGNGTNVNGFPNLNLNNQNVSMIHILRVNRSVYHEAGGTAGAQLLIFSENDYQKGDADCTHRGDGTSALLWGSFDEPTGEFNEENISIIVNSMDDKLYYSTDDFLTYSAKDISALDDTKKWYLGIRANAHTAGGVQGAGISIYDINYTQASHATMSVESSFNPGSTGNFSILTWVKPRTTIPLRNVSGIFSKEFNSTHNRIALYQYNDTFRVEIEDNESNLLQVNSSRLIEASSWYHIGAVLNRQENQLRLYVNGSLEGNASTLSILNISSLFTSSNKIGRVVIGGIGSFLDYFNGTMDSTRVYDDAMESSEVLIEYNVESQFLNVNSSSYSILFVEEGLVNYSFSFEVIPANIVTCFVGNSNDTVYYGDQVGNECIVNFSAPFDANFTFIPSFNRTNYTVFNESSFNGLRGAYDTFFWNTTIISNLSSQHFIKEYVIWSNSSTSFKINFSDGIGESIEVTVPAYSSIRINQSFSGDYLIEDSSFRTSGDIILDAYATMWRNITFNNSLALEIPDFSVYFVKESIDFPTWQKGSSAQSYTYNSTHINGSIDALINGSVEEYRHGFYAKTVSITNRSAASIYSVTDLTDSYRFQEAYVPFVLLNLSNETLLSTSFAISTYLPNWGSGSSISNIDLIGSGTSVNFSYVHNTTHFSLNFSNYTNSNLILTIEYEYTRSGTTLSGGSEGTIGRGRDVAKIIKIAGLDVKPVEFQAWCFVFEPKDCFRKLTVNRIDAFCSPDEGFHCYVANNTVFFGLKSVIPSEIDGWYDVVSGNATILSPGERVGVYGEFRLVNIGVSMGIPGMFSPPKWLFWLFNTDGEGVVDGLRIFGLVVIILISLILLWVYTRLRAKVPSIRRDKGGLKRFFELE